MKPPSKATHDLSNHEVVDSEDPTAAASKLCPDCDGDGYFIYLGSPGYFCPSFGNYLPTEKQITCETCNGYGELDPWDDDPNPQEPYLDDELDDYDESELPF